MYVKRLKQFLPYATTIEERVLKAGTEKEEHKRLLDALTSLPKPIVLLDERGKEFSSRDFASWLIKIGNTDKVTFVIGGAYGFGNAIREKADYLLSLSKMTFPHELAKLLFLEQLFRADSILRGSGYHH